MTDRNVPPAPPDDELRAALRELLAADEGAGEGMNAAHTNGSPVADAAEVAGRVESLALGTALAPGSERGPALDPSRADVTLLADLGHALAQTESGAAEGPSQAVLSAAREAFVRAGGGGSAVPTEALVAEGVASATARAVAPGLRLLHGRRPTPVAAFVRALAAVLVVAIGVAWFVRPRSAEAQPVLLLAGVDRYAMAGSSSGDGGAHVIVGGRLEARPGASFVAGSGELLSLRLADGGRLVLRGGERLEVVAADAFTRATAGEVGALLRLQGGEVLLACEPGPAPGPVALVLTVPPSVLLPPLRSPRGEAPGGEPRAGPPSGGEGGGTLLGVLVLRRGSAHVAQPAGHEASPAVALSDDASAVFSPYAGSRAKAAPIELRGPAQVLLSADGAVVEGEPARAIFRDLEMFGGPLLERRAEPFVSARLWRVLSGRAQRGGDGVELRRAGGSRPPQEANPGAPRPDVVLAWKPDPAASRARSLRLVLRGPAGLTVSLPDLGSTAVLPAAGSAAEPGLVTVDLALPEGWTALLPADGELRLSMGWPSPGSAAPGAGAAAVRFEGAFLGSAALGAGI